MKVGIISYDFYPPIGGQGIYVYQIYKRLEKNGIEPFVFSARKNDMKNSIYVPSTNQVIFSLYVNLLINHWIEKYNLNLVHFQGGPGGVFLVRKPKVPLIYTAHHLYYQKYKLYDKYLFKLLTQLEKRGYLLADRVVSVSSKMKNVLSKEYLINEEKITVIHNGIDLNTFKYIKMEKIANSLLFVGRLHKIKGIEFLLDAIKIVKSKIPSVKLYIIGDGDLKEKIERIIQENSLSENVELLGMLPQKELVNWYNKTEIFILPSLFEGFGIVVLEAMACGTPVIITKGCGAVDVVQNMENGVIIEPQNSIELANSILNLMENNGLMEKIRSNGIKSIQDYDWDIIVHNLINDYAFINKSS